MKIWSPILPVVIIAIASVSFAQAQQYDRLMFKVFPANWSEQTQADHVMLSNYNIKGADLLNVSIFKGQEYTGKPEQAFAVAWRSFFKLADTTTAPHQRRNYTVDSDMFFTGAEQRDGPQGKGYYLMALYIMKNYVQPIIIKADNMRVFEPQQSDWQDVLQQVVVAK